MIQRELTELIGKTEKPIRLEVEKGAIRKYVDAIGDRNPMYWSEGETVGAGAGPMSAPPGFFGWPTTWDTAMPLVSHLLQELLDTANRCGYKKLLAGGQEFDFYHPVKAGDALIAVAKLIEMNEREGRSGNMVLSTIETTYTNQDGQIVAKMRLRSILR